MVDVVFLTSFYQQQKRLDNYIWMIFVMVLLTLSEIYLFQTPYIILIQVFSYFSATYAFTKNLSAVVSLSVCFAIMAALEVFFAETLKLPYEQSAVLTGVFKLSFIFVFYKQIGNVFQKVNLPSITKKVLYVSFLFICLAISLYIQEKGR